MKPRTMERLDLLAADTERRLLDDVRRHQATLAQAEEQRRVLAAYRARLSESWRGGAAVSVAEARSAGHFVTASQAADVQIDQMETRARQQLAAALDALARVQVHRQSLEEALAKAAREAERDVETRQERARPWRAHPERGTVKE